MKNLRRAAISVAAGIVALIGSSALFANTNGWVIATGYDTQTTVVTGITKFWQTESLRHGGFTQHQFIGNPGLIPPGVCRAIAITWDIGVFQHRSTAWFDKELAKSAQHNCNLTFVRLDGANADGSFNLVTVAPAK